MDFKIRRIVPVIESSRFDETKQFYGEFLGLELAMDMGWVLNYISKENPTAQVIIVKSENGPVNPGVSISAEVPDLDTVYDRAVSMNYQITYPKTKEPWGVERFFVKDPNGVTINLMRHI
ncbi:MAG TPA: VOC family protein [Ignavibacteriaceae bacterium]|nr:VOC family protein [Ignavibacteriaceae bacterium]